MRGDGALPGKLLVLEESPDVEAGPVHVEGWATPRQWTGGAEEA